MVYAKLELEIFNGDIISTTVNELPFPYEKHYPNDDIDCKEYVDNPEKTAFLAYVDAFKFYSKCGFVLGGFDKYLHNGIGNPNEEIALYWYLIFQFIWKGHPQN